MLKKIFDNFNDLVKENIKSNKTMLESNNNQSFFKDLVNKNIESNKTMLLEYDKINKSLMNEFKLSLDKSLSQNTKIINPSQPMNIELFKELIDNAFKMHQNYFDALFNNIKTLNNNNRLDTTGAFNKDLIEQLLNKNLIPMIKDLSNILNATTNKLLEMSKEKEQVVLHEQSNTKITINKESFSCIEIEEALKKLYLSINNSEHSESHCNIDSQTYFTFICDNYINKNEKLCNSMKKILLIQYNNFSLEEFFDFVLIPYFQEQIKDFHIINFSDLINHNNNSKKYVQSALDYFKRTLFDRLKIEEPLIGSLKELAQDTRGLKTSIEFVLKDISKQKQIEKEAEQKILELKQQKEVLNQKKLEDALDYKINQIIKKENKIFNYLKEKNNISLSDFFEFDLLEKFFQYFCFIKKERSLLVEDFFNIFLTFFNHIDSGITWDVLMRGNTQECRDFLKLINKLYSTFINECILREKDTERSIDFFILNKYFLFKYKSVLDFIINGYSKNKNNIIKNYDYKKKFESQEEKTLYENNFNTSFVIYFKMYNDLFEVNKSKDNVSNICYNLFFKKILTDIIIKNKQDLDNEKINEKKQDIDNEKKNDFISNMREQLNNPDILVSKIIDNFNQNTKDIMNAVILCFEEYKFEYKDNEEKVLYTNKLKSKFSPYSRDMFFIPTDYQRLPVFNKLSDNRVVFELLGDFKYGNKDIAEFVTMPHYLLHGVPGTGKTLAIKNEIVLLADNGDRIFYFKFDHEVDSIAPLLTLIKDYIKIVMNDVEKEKASRIIFCIQIDEIDSISKDRTKFKDSQNIEKTDALLTFFDDVDAFNKINKGEFANCFIQVYGTTNHHECIDPAVKRAGRMNLVEVLPPSPREKNIYFDKHLEMIKKNVFSTICRKYTELLFGENETEISENFFVSKITLSKVQNYDCGLIHNSIKEALKTTSCNIKKIIRNNYENIVSNKDNILNKANTYIEIKNKMDEIAVQNFSDINEIVRKNKSFYNVMKLILYDSDTQKRDESIEFLNQYQFI